MLRDAKDARQVPRVPSGLPYAWQRYGKYTVWYAAVVLLVALTQLWKYSDLALFNIVIQFADLQGASQVVAIDLDAERTDVREQLCRLLDSIARRGGSGPDAVVIDIGLSRRRPPDRLRASIEKLKTHTQVFAAVAPAPAVPTGDRSATLDADLYEAQSLFTAVGHAMLQLPPALFGSERVVGFYPERLAVPLGAADTLPAATVTRFPAIPLAVDYRHNSWLDNRSLDPIPADDVFWTGPRSALTLVKATNVRELEATGLDQKIVVIGNLKSGVRTAKGPSQLELLAWAIGDRFIATKPFFSGAIMWLATALLSAVAVAAVVGVWRGMKTRAHVYPLVTLIAFGVAFSLLMLADVALLRMHWVFTELTLVLIGIVTSIAVALIWTNETLRHERLLEWLRRRAKRNELERFDVFISYARTAENISWVKREILEPLRGARRADGTPLKIFFDTASIAPGMAWYERIVDAIEGSRYFLPIYTDDYFARYYCRDEIELAMLRRGELAQTDDCILPLSRMSCRPVSRKPRVPPRAFRELQIIDTRKTPHFMDIILNKLLSDHSHLPVGADAATAVS